jgi:hypothetical protein
MRAAHVGMRVGQPSMRAAQASSRAARSSFGVTRARMQAPRSSFQDAKCRLASGLKKKPLVIKLGAVPTPEKNTDRATRRNDEPAPSAMTSPAMAHRTRRQPCNGANRSPALARFGARRTGRGALLRRKLVHAAARRGNAVSASRSGVARLRSQSPSCRGLSTLTGCGPERGGRSVPSSL